MDKRIKATDFAARAHSEQRRKDQKKTPYINHPIEATWLLSQGGVTDVDTLCAAVLHDTIEDTGVTYEELCREFGENVANIVRECSDNKSLPKVERKQEQIVHARAASTSAKLVKAADKLSNLSGLDSNPPTSWSREEIDGYFSWSYAVWQAVAGCNEFLDSKLRELFAAKGLVGISDADLNARLAAYYTRIDRSE